jgi:hypothetical protein
VADDIVTRLRTFECRCEVCDEGMRCEACEAADEIERLRAAGDILAKHLRLAADERMLEQTMLHGSVSVQAAMLRACTEWDKVRCISGSAGAADSVAQDGDRG